MSLATRKMWEEPAHVALRHYQDWVLPPRVIRVILTLALFCVFVGMILVSVGGGLHNSRLMVGGGVLAGLGACGLLMCLLLCLHACFLFRVRDQAVQTEDSLWREEEHPPHPLPTTTHHLPTATHPLPTATHHLPTATHPLPTATHPLPTATHSLPSAMKSAESTLRRQTGEAKKSVSYSGEVQCYSPTTPSPTLSSTSFLSSVFSSPAGTLDRGGGGRGPAGGGGVGGPGPQRLPLPTITITAPQESQSLPRNLRLQQLIEDNDYDVPVERTPMLAPSGRPLPPPELTDSGSVKSAGAEVSMPALSLLLSRTRHVALEGRSSTSDYDNI